MRGLLHELKLMKQTSDNSNTITIIIPGNREHIFTVNVGKKSTEKKPKGKIHGKN